MIPVVNPYIVNLNPDRTWDGGGADDNWSTPQNWVGDIAPVPGDTLRFAGVVRLNPVNNLAPDTKFNDIEFVAGAGAFTLSGNRFELLGDVLQNATPNNQSINNDVILNGNTFINLTSDLYFNGIVSGTGSLETGGPNVSASTHLLNLNTYTGRTVVTDCNYFINTLDNAGVPQSLGMASALSFNIELIGLLTYPYLIYTGLTTSTDRGYTCTYITQPYCVFYIANAGVDVTINGIIDGNGVASFGGIGSGVNNIILTGLNTVTFVEAFFLSTVKLTNLANIGIPCAAGIGDYMGAYDINTVLEYTGPTVSTDKIIYGSGVFRSSTAGTLTLTGSSIIDGSIEISTGVLSVSASANLGADACEVVFPSTSGQLLITNSFSSNHELQAIGAARQINLDIPTGVTLTQNADVRSYNHGNPVLKYGDGTLILTADNEQLDTNLSQLAGVVDIRNAGALGNTGTDLLITAAGLTARFTNNSGMSVTGAVRVNGDGVTYVVDRTSAGAGVTHSVNTLTVNGAYTVNFSAGANCTSGTAGFTVRSTTTLGGNTVLNTQPTGASGLTVTLTGVVSGAFSLTKDGSGQLTLSASNTYSGGTVINGGIVLAQTNNNALSNAGTVTINAGATRLLIQDNRTISRPIVINGGNPGAGRGLIENTGGALCTLNGAITINGSTSSGCHFSNANGTSGLCTVNGAITSSVPVVTQGFVIFNGGGSYSSLIHEKSTIRIDTNNGIATNATLTLGVTAAATFDMARRNQSLVGIVQGAFAGDVGNISTVADSILTLTGSCNWAGVIRDVLFGGTKKVLVTINSSGTVVFSGANVYTGATTISAGTLQITGSLGNTAVAVNNGTLSGPSTTGASATITGTVTVANSATAIIQPGSFGDNVLNTGALTFSGVNSKMIANSTTTAFSRIAVTGNVALGGCTIDFPAGITTNGTYQIITATGVMAGVLPSVGVNGTGKTLVLQQTGNNLEVVVS